MLWGKVILSWQQTWPNCVHILVFLWKVEFVNIEVGYLAEVISKQRVEGMVWLLLTAYSKMWEERNELKKEFFSKKEPELNILENIHSVHIAKNAKCV